MRHTYKGIKVDLSFDGNYYYEYTFTYNGTKYTNTSDIAMDEMDAYNWLIEDAKEKIDSLT